MEPVEYYSGARLLPGLPLNKAGISVRRPEDFPIQDQLPKDCGRLQIEDHFLVSQGQPLANLRPGVEVLE